MRTPLPLSPALVATLTLLAAPLAALAQGQVYKYTDDRGQVHYTDRAPSDAQQIKGPTPVTAPAAARPATTPAATTPQNNAAPPLPVSAAQNQQVQQDLGAVRAEQCKTARENYDKGIRAQRLFKLNDKGEREFLPVADVENARLQMKAEMDSVCGT